MKKILSLIALLLFTYSVFANLSATVDRTQLAEGESLSLTINLPSSSTQPDLTPLQKDFTVYGTSNSSSTRIINGHRQSSYQLQVTLMPKHLGRLSIPALQVGQQQTAPINITVSKSSAKLTAQQHRTAFLRVEIQPQQTYVNSPVVYTLKLYFSKSIQGGRLLPGQADNVTLKPFGKEKDYAANVGGKTYQVVEQHYLLTPNKAGKIVLPSVQFQGSIAEQSNNGFFGFPSSKPITLRSNKVTLNVKAKPTNISADSWLPADRVSISSQWSPQSTQLTAGQPVTRTVTIKAVGITPDNIPDINFAVPNNVNAYPSQPTIQQTVVNGKLVSTKTYKIAYVPTAKGQVEFPQINLPWWNINTDKAETATLAAQQFSVAAGQLTTPTANVAPIAVSSNAKVTPATLVKTSNPIWQWLTFVFAALWVITLITWFLKRKPRAESNTDNSVKYDYLLMSVKRACLNNDAKQIQTSVISWAKIFCADDGLTSLAKVGQHFHNQELMQLLQAVEKNIYAEQSFQAGEALWQCLKKLSQQQKAQQQKNILKPLYPE